MDSSNQDIRLKNALKHALLDLFSERRELFVELIREALIREGEKEYGLSPEEPIPDADGASVPPATRARRAALAMRFKAGLAGKNPYTPAPNDWYEQ